ncbi:MAG: globin [Bacteroidetes bacterium]|nr:MAG: globin [Bacteroidota bacterium]
MELNISPASIGMRPKVELPNSGFLEHLKEEGIRKLVSDHYDLLSKSEIKHLFPPSKSVLEIAKLKSSDFFIQICGGHPYFNENQGKPMLSRRHSPFKITAKGREVWLNCYQQILPDLEIPEEYILSFWNYLNIFSMWMINNPEDGY